MENIESLLQAASLEEIKRGYRQQGEVFVCVCCGYQTESGIVYPEDGVLYESERYMRVHIEKVHGSVFEYLLELDKSVTDAKVDKRELEMAKRLVEDMSGPWTPEDYHDAFRQTILDLVEEKAAKGKISVVEKGEGAAVQKGADIVDLTELLKRSLGGGKKAAPEKKPAKRSRKAS